MQENINSHGRPTPSRRRNGRQANRQPGQKMYASENDASINSHGAFRQTPQPSTPAKLSSATPESYFQESTSASKSSRLRNTSGKPRARNTAVTSPDSPRVAAARKTPPNSLPTGKVATAYAGSTFHASPAPSALPIPSFYSKGSASPVPSASKLQPQPPNPLDAEREAPTPSRPSLLPAQDSPLEAIFRADRAEKERARRASFATSSRKPGLVSPLQTNLGESPTVLRQYMGLSHERAYTQRSSPGIPISELDGASAGPLMPPFSTPYHERIQAAHGNPPPASSANTTIGPGEDPSQALKRVLFGPKAGTSWAPAPAPPVPAPATATPAARPSGVAEMEDSLRRILKLS